MVVCFHYLNFNNGIEYIIPNDEIRNYEAFGAKGVNKFYIISGFVIVYAMTNNGYKFMYYAKYVLNRIIRIIPTYAITIFAIFIFSQIICYKTFDWDWKQILSNLTFTVDSWEGQKWINPVFITLKVEFQFYLALGLLLPIIMKNNFLKFFIYSAWLLSGRMTYEEQTFLLYSPYFITGITLFEIYSNKEIILNSVILACLFLFVFYYHDLQDTIIMLMTVILILWLKINSGLIAFYGKISYSLYLTHGLTGGWFLFFTTKDNYFHINHGFAILIALALSILGAYFFHLLIEKPSINTGNRIRYDSGKLFS